MPDRRPITICEYEAITKHDVYGTKRVSPEVFDALLGFVGDSNELHPGTDSLHDALRLTSVKGKPALKAQNYVGVIEAGSTTIEILPKIAQGVGLEPARAVFLEMLSHLRELPFKHLGKAGLETARMPILELFIAAFLDEVASIVRRGIRSDYVDWSGNERFLKGRLDFPRHFASNHSDKLHFVVEYSLFHVNRPENRLLRSTLDLLSSKSRLVANRRRLRAALDFFCEVPGSLDFAADFGACKLDRNMAHYSTALAWCRVFLEGRSFTSFAGVTQADALLFPMERVFQDYVASKLKCECSMRGGGISIRVQDSSRHLFERPSPTYQLVPDIVAISGEKQVVLDTKWKLHGRPDQSDMYQMFAYAVKYENVDDVVLVYPSQQAGVPSLVSADPFEADAAGRIIRIHTFSFGLLDAAGPSAESELASFLEKLLNGSGVDEP